MARALAILAGEPYGRCYRDLAKANKQAGFQRSARNGIRDKVWVKVFQEYGLVRVKLPAGPRPTYTEAYQKYANCIVGTTKHVCAIVGGELRDTFDGRTYEWGDTVTYKDGVTTVDPAGTRTRKAQSFWVPRENTIPDRIFPAG